MNIKKIKKAIEERPGAEKIGYFAEKFSKKLDEPIRHILIGKTLSEKISNLVLIAETKNKCFILNDKGNFQSISKENIEEVTFISGVPNGAFSIKVNNKTQKFTDIQTKNEMVSTFITDLKPQPVYKANYDNLQRFQNNFLTNVEHAQEIDEQRYRMQMGEISQHDFDSLNPTLPKAGK